MLERVLREIPKLTEAVVGADVHGDPSYRVADTGAADAVRAAGTQTKRTARQARSRAGRIAVRLESAGMKKRIVM